MPVRKTPSKGGKPDKLMRDALLLELQSDSDQADSRGKKIKRLRLVARKLVDRAIEGDIPAIKEINERVDGKVAQAIVGDKDADPVQVSITGADTGLL